LAIKLEVLGSIGHRKYAPMTPEETEQTIKAIEAGRVQGLGAGSYYLINKNTQRIVGKVGIQDNQELIMIPVARGG